jgi:PAS domain S-box-containing protein
MNWGAIGLVYVLVYAALVSRSGLSDHARLLAGNIALLPPPLVTIGVIAYRAYRRTDWTGRQRLFWLTIAAGAALWFSGQVVWVYEELGRANFLPWFTWFIVIQLCGSALPLIALVAAPHRGPRSEMAVTAAIDICALACVTAFLYWSLIIAPGMVPDRSTLALRTLATIGPLVRLLTAVGFLWSAWVARDTPWAASYRRIASGMLLAFGVLIALSILAVHGGYQTGSVTTVGWMLPFWFSAWAAAVAPASPPELSPSIAQPRRLSQPLVLFVAIVLVPIVGYGVRILVPLGDPLDRYRDLVTALTIVSGLGFIMMRFRVEQHAVDHANERVRLLATACEQSMELIAVARGRAIVYANEAFRRATGYSHGELEALSPAQLVAGDSIPATAGAVERLGRREAVRLTLMLARKDGTTFQAACAVAPLVAPDGTATHFVGVVRDLTDELALRDQLVKSERLSAIGQLVSGVAHEINDPLQAVVGGLDVVLADVHAATVRADVERMKDEASRAVRIVRNLIAFVRRGPRERMLHDLNEIVQTTVSLRARELEHANIDLQEIYGQSMPLVAVNRDEMQQIVMNLMLHAEQGIAGHERRGRIVVRTFVSGKDAIAEVADNGWGVPAATAPRIFEPFVTTREGGHVAGLGLSIAFSIAAAHGGTLELVPSSSLEGACFRLRLPGSGFPGPAAVQ